VPTRRSRRAGAVVVLPGREGGITATGADLFTQNDLTGAVAEAGDHFGGALAIGSFKRPFYSDLVVGAPDEDYASVADAGVAYIFFGRDSSLSASDIQFVPRLLPGAGIGTSERFAAAPPRRDSTATRAPISPSAYRASPLPIRTSAKYSSCSRPCSPTASISATTPPGRLRCRRASRTAG
jgi:hypothetical protein